MDVRVQPWQLAVILLLLCAGVIGIVYLTHSHSITKPAELASFLPAKESVVLYVDVAKIRSSGLLNLLSGSRAAEELEYAQFVADTAFDYRQDLDALAATYRAGKFYFVLRGRFRWRNLKNYAEKRGGTCHNGYCSVEGSRPQRIISFYPLKSDLMAMSVSDDEASAYEIKANNASFRTQLPDTPVWMLIPSAALNRPNDLPSAVQAYASALRGAQQIVIAMGPQGDGLDLVLMVLCKDDASASNLLANFESTTTNFRQWTVRKKDEKMKSGEDGETAPDLASVFANGSFRRADRQVRGDFPITRQFLDRVVSSSY